jgi:hypothetical protein
MFSISILSIVLGACTAESAGDDGEGERTAENADLGANRRAILEEIATKTWSVDRAGQRWGTIPIFMNLGDANHRGKYTISGNGGRTFDLYGLSFAPEATTPPADLPTASLLRGRSDRAFTGRFTCPSVRRVEVPIAAGESAPQIASRISGSLAGTGCELRTRSAGGDAVWMALRITVSPDVGIAIPPIDRPPTQVTVVDGHQLVFSAGDPVHQVFGNGGSSLRAYPMQLLGRERKLLTLSKNPGDSFTYTHLELASEPELHTVAVRPLTLFVFRTLR